VLYEGYLYFLLVKKIMPDMGKDGRLGLGNARHFPSTLNFPLTISKTQIGSCHLSICNNVSMLSFYILFMDLIKPLFMTSLLAAELLGNL
jgi:hypothetical protein